LGRLIADFSGSSGDHGADGCLAGVNHMYPLGLTLLFTPASYGFR
jgi:hypothetical protein